jgi:hypothetical protein
MVTAVHQTNSADVCAKGAAIHHGGDEKIFGVKEQILGWDQSD